MPPASTQMMAAGTYSATFGSKMTLDKSRWGSASMTLQGSCKDAVSLVKERRIEFVPSKHHKTHASNVLKGIGKRSELNGSAAAAKSRMLVDTVAVDRLARWQKPRKIGPGFSNLGNTCYLNSVLQCLSYTPCLAQFLLQHPVKDAASNKQLAQGQHGFCGLRAMHKLLQTVHTPNANHGNNHGNKHGFGNQNGRVIQPRAFVMNVRHLSKRFRIGRQEDAHEFFRLLMDSMQHSCLRQAGISDKASKQSALDKKVAQTTLIHRVFGGKLQNHLKCDKCGFVSERNDDFMDLSLELPQGTNSLRQALDHFTSIERLDASNAWKCSSCNKLSCAEKGLSILTMPQVLVLQLKRFDGMFGKIKKHIQFEETLDLKRNMRKTISKTTGKPMVHANTKYELFAVLVHAGYSTDCGHYYAFVKGPSGQWYEMNDESVRWVNLDTVLQQRAYMLFYSRIIPAVKDPPASSPKEEESSSSASKAAMSVVASASAASQNGLISSKVLEAQDKAAKKAVEETGTVVAAPQPAAVVKKPALTCVVKYSFHPVQLSAKGKHRAMPRFHGLMGKLLRYSSKAQWKDCALMEMQQHVCAVRESSSTMATSQNVKENQVLPPKPKATVPFHPKMVRDHGTEAMLYGKQVNGWQDVDQDDNATHKQLESKHQQILSKLKQEDFERRRAGRQDEWDEALDMGKTKKLKKRKQFVVNEGQSNAFQLALQQKKLKVQ